MKITTICLTILLIGIFISTTAFARPTYVGSDFELESGVLSPNVQTMDTAFGEGNWDHFTFANAMTSGLLSGGPDFIYIDGSKKSFHEFMNFVNINRTALEDWVRRGGSLFMNATSTREYILNFDMGFDVTLHRGCSYKGYAIDSTHPIFNGPNGNAGTNWTGSYFAFDYVTGTDLTYLISGWKDFNVLGEKDYGLGHLMVGGMNPNYWNDSQPYTDILQANILNYGADCAADPL